MIKLYNCLLVDPFREHVLRIQLPEERFLDSCKNVMGITSPIDIITLANDRMIILDDEGLLNDVTQRYFKLDEYPQPLAGRAIIVSFDDEGETKDIDSEAFEHFIQTTDFKPDGHVESPYMAFTPLP